MSVLTINEKINILCETAEFYNSAELENVIKKYNISFTQNNNGMFLNISLLDTYIIEEIYSLFTMKNEHKYFYDIDTSMDISITCEKLLKPTKIKCISKKNMKENVKHTKLDYLILKILNENLNLI